MCILCHTLIVRVQCITAHSIYGHLGRGIIPLGQVIAKAEHQQNIPPLLDDCSSIQPSGEKYALGAGCIAANGAENFAKISRPIAKIGFHVLYERECIFSPERIIGDLCFLPHVIIC